MRWLIVFLLLFCMADAPAQKPVFSIGATAHYGTIFVHSPQLQKTEGARPRGGSLDLIWQMIDEQTWNTCNCFPRMGFSMTYFDYTNSILGHSGTLSYFIEPSFRIYKGFQFALRGSLGLSYLSNPYDAETNPNNMSYSLPVSGYLGFSAGSNIKMGERSNLALFTNFFHISNGGIKDPNKGIDWLTFSLGFDYTLVKTKLPDWPKKKTDLKAVKPRIDAYVLLTGRNAQVGDKTFYPIYGIGFNISRQVSRLNALTLGAEWHEDLAMKELLRRENRGHYHAQFGGVLAGNEFLLGKFIFSQQLGVYYLKKNPDYPWLYHRYGLFYRFSDHTGAGINFKAYGEYAHFLDMRFVYSF